MTQLTPMLLGGVEIQIVEHPSVPAHVPHVIGAVCRRTRIPSFVARTLTGGARWSHIGCVDFDEGNVIEALVGPGVVRTPAAVWVERYRSFEFFRTLCPRPDLARAYWRKCADECQPYDYLGAAAVPFRATFQDPHAKYCSELWEDGLEAGGRVRHRIPGHARSPMEGWYFL